MASRVANGTKSGHCNDTTIIEGSSYCSRITLYGRSTQPTGGNSATHRVRTTEYTSPHHAYSITCNAV